MAAPAAEEFNVTRPATSGNLTPKLWGSYVETAYSYIRWSDIRQSQGDSKKRQTELREAWLAAHPAVTLDTSMRLVDKGVGGFRGKNRSDAHCLGQFVRAVERGSVRPGSYLLIENLDRLSREQIHDATTFLLQLTKAGIVVVQLSPVVVEFRYPVSLESLILAVVEMSRAHGESKLKSERVTKAWNSAREAARKTGAVANLSTLPGWCRKGPKGLELIPERARVVKDIHQWAADGLGVLSIAKRLNEKGVPTWGRSAKWSEIVVYQYLTSRSVIGEWQPGKGGRGVPRETCGDPIPGYFPRCVTDDVFHRTQAAISKRRGFRGRRGKHVNLLAGLLVDGISRGRMSYSHEKRGSYVFSQTGRAGTSPAMTYPAEVLERQVLSVLREVDPASIIGDDGSDVLAAEGRVSELDKQIAALTEALAGRAVKAVVDRLAVLEVERAEAAAALEKARQAAAVPSAASWQEVRTLAEGGGETVRLRLQSALRHVVQCVYFVGAGHKSGRYRAYVEVVFDGGQAFRSAYLWADTGHTRSKREAADGIAGHWKSGPDEVVSGEPLLADPSSGPDAAAGLRAEMVRQLRGEPQEWDAADGPCPVTKSPSRLAAGCVG